MMNSAKKSEMMGTPLPQSAQKSNYRIKQLERQVNQYRSTINEKNEQIQYLSQRNSQIVHSKSPSSSNKKKADNIYQSSLQQQIERLTVRLSQKTKQCERLFQKNQAMQNDIVALQDFTNDLDRQRRFLADKLANIQIHTEGDEVVGELENKLVLMSTEIMRLGQLNRNKSQQNNDLKFKLREREQQKQLIQNELNQKQKTIIKYREKLRALQKRLLQQQSNTSYENQSNYKILSLQIQRLNVQLSNKIEQISTLQHRNRMLQQKHMALSSSSAYKNNYGQLNIEVQRLTKVNMTHKQQIQQLQMDIKKIKRQNKQLSEQNQKYKRSLKKLEDELDQTKKNYIKNQDQKIKIEVEMSEKTIRQQKTIIQNLQRQTQLVNQQREQKMRMKFQQQVYNLKLLLQQSQSNCSSLQADIMKYEQKLVMLSQQIQRLSIQNVRHQEQNAELKRLQFKIESRQRQMRQIQRTKESAFTELKRQKSQLQRYKNQVKQLWDKNRQLQSKQYKLNSLKDELQITLQRLQVKQRECKLLQQKVQSASLRNSGYRAQQLQIKLQSERKAFKLKQQQATYNSERQRQYLKQTIHKLQLRIRQLSSQQNVNSSNYALLAEQIRRLNEVLSESSDTIIRQKRDINLLQANLETAQQSVQKMGSMHMSNQKLQQQLQKHTEVYNKQLRIFKQQNESLKHKLQQFVTNAALNQQQTHNLRLAIQDTKQTLRRKQQQLKDVLEDARSSKRNQEGLYNLIRQIRESNLRLQRKLAQIEQDYIRRLQQKSIQKQNLQRQYLDYNRKIRESQHQQNDLKFQLSSLQNKLELLTKRQNQLEHQNQRLQSKLDEQLRDKTNVLKVSNEEYRNRMYEYEQEIKRNAKHIGEIQSELNNKNDIIYKIQSTVRQLQQEKFRLQNQNKDIQQERRRQNELKSQEVQFSLDIKQQQNQNLKQRINKLEQQVSQKRKIIDKNKQLILEYQNKLALLSQQLERMNVNLYNKGLQFQNFHQKYVLMEQKLDQFSNNNSKQTKQTIQLLTIEITRLNTTLCQSLQHIRQLELQLQNKNREIKRNGELTKKNQEVLKDKIFQLQQQVEKYSSQSHKYSANFGVMNRKLQDLQKLERQNQEIKQKLIQLNTEKNKYKNQIIDLESQVSRIKNSYENNLQQQQYSINSKASLKLTQLEQSKRQLQKKVSMLVGENQQLVSQIQNLKRQLEQSDKQYRETNKKLIKSQNECVNLKRQKEKYQLLNQQILSKIEKMNIGRTIDQCDKQAYQFRVKHLQTVIKQYQNQMMLMKQQMQKVNRERSKSKDGNSSLGSSNARISSHNNSLSKGNATQLQQKYNILQSLHLKLKRQADGLRQKVTQYQFKMKKLKGEFELINKLTHDYKDQNQYLRSQNHSQCVYVGKILQNQAVSMPSSSNQTQNRNQQLLVKQTLTVQIDRLGILNTNLRKQVQDLRLMTVESQTLKNRYQQFMCIFVLMAAELESLRLKQ